MALKIKVKSWAAQNPLDQAQRKKTNCQPQQHIKPSFERRSTLFVRLIRSNRIQILTQAHVLHTHAQLIKIANTNESEEGLRAGGEQSAALGREISPGCAARVQKNSTHTSEIQKSVI
jgi:hypothetical protein